MVVPEWIWIVFTFAFGCCIGSFLNVVICRLPRDKSLIKPPSACPACGKLIRFYDNIPLVSWLVLGRKCRYCKEPISPRYFIIELLSGLVFTGLFYLYFRSGLLAGVPSFLSGGWLIYLILIILLAGLIASSAIDLELWVIPISICWFVTIAGIIASGTAVFFIDPKVIYGYSLLPYASTKTASLAVGAAAGLAISLLLLATGLIKRSYESEAGSQKSEVRSEPEFDHRLEMCKEILFLLPIVICSVGLWFVLCGSWLDSRITNYEIRAWWLNFLQAPVVAGLLGSLWGYFIGCAVVWATRISGTLAFGREAMGLGDVHLMGAAGAVTGPVLVVVAFFIAPFFGLAWAALQMFFKKTRQIPYGPFLSLGILSSIILHDRIFNYISVMFFNGR